MLKSYVLDGFYCIGLRPSNTPKLGLGFPVDYVDELMFAIPLTLPIGWKKVTPLFCISAETIVVLVNQSLYEH